jgi:mannosyltransferase
MQKILQNKRSGHVIFLTALMLGVAVFAITVLFQQSLRLDEAQSLWQVSRGPAAIMKAVAGDVHVPFYHLLLHFWVFFFGSGVFAARSLSLIFFVATIPMVYKLGKESYNDQVGTYAALLVAVSPFLNWYGSEVRMYSMLAFLAVANQYLFFKIYNSLKIKPHIWWLYGLTAVAGVLTHYFFVFALAAQAAIFLIKRSNFNREAFRGLIMVAVVVIAALGAWLGYVYYVGEIGNSTPFLAKPTSIDLFNSFSSFLFGFQNDHINSLILSLWPLAVLFAFMSLNSRRVAPFSIYFFLAAILPILAAFFVSIVYRPLYLTRYLILTVPALYLFLAWFFSLYPRRIALTFQTLLVAGMILTMVRQVAGDDIKVKEDFRGVVQHLNEQAGPQDIIIASAPFTVYPIEYYYRGDAAIRTLPMWNRFVPGPIPSFSEEKLPEEVEKVNGGHEKAWLVLGYDQGYEETIRMYFEKNFERIEAREFSPGLNLYVYRLRYDTPRAMR